MTTKATTFKALDFTSTNGIGNILVFVLLAAGAVFGIGEDAITALVTAAVPIGLFIREILEGARKPRWAGNIVTYLSSAVLLLAPWLEDLLGAVSPIADALATGNFNAIWVLLIPVVNALLLLFKSKPWQTEDNITTT
jgi:hypothetical protein